MDLVFSHVVSLSVGYGEMIGPLHFRVKEWEPGVEALEVHKSLWLFIEVKVPNVFT